MESEYSEKARYDEREQGSDHVPNPAPDLLGHWEDILAIAGLITTSVNRDAVISEAVEHLARRLHKRARCAILEGDKLVLRHSSGHYESPLDGKLVSEQSVVWEIFKEGKPLNLTDEYQGNGYEHTLKNGISLKAVVPFGYLDPVTEEEKNLGALIVDSGEKGLPISEQEFEYLKIIGLLIGSVVGRIELFDQLTASYVTQQKILKETAHNFRNRMVVIGGLCRRILKLNTDKDLGDDVSLLYKQVRALEEHVDRFESYMGDPRSD
ncbi:MAG TPA: hypothetical protein DCR97_09225 [Deltaproteobacteria bacterium]|nr:hypothetical protein [Deltaproteobacteria bacterium]